MDPVELRRRNLYNLGDITPTGQVLRESVSASECLEKTIKAADYARRRRALDAANKKVRAQKPGSGPRKVRGIGVSLVHHGAGFTGSGEVKLKSIAALDLAPDGRPRVLAASTEIGQGTATIFAQMTAEPLGVSDNLVVVAQPDTGNVPDSGPTVASRTCMVVGGLLAKAAGDLRARLLEHAPGGWKTDAQFLKVARAHLKQHGALRIDRQYEKPSEINWNDDTYQGDAYGCFGWACNLVEVEVDLDTGEVVPIEVVTAQDIGKAIHPRLVEGQIEGGVTQGLGYALLEEIRWKDGRVWNQQLTNYIIPTSLDTPPIRVILVENPYSRGPFGAKGVGELPMDGPAPAVVAAVRHATGIWLDEIPVTPERLLPRLLENPK
jgi:CO/xanthine dehydrogenase Mo-binding subunit